MRKILSILWILVTLCTPAMAEPALENVPWDFIAVEAEMAQDDPLYPLRAGNARYLAEDYNAAPLTPRRRADAAENGQTPYAVVVTCSDSRVPPEHIFAAGIGDLFVVRTAGNVLDEIAMGSIEYGVEHLNAPIVLVMGHTGCGAVASGHGGRRSRQHQGHHRQNPDRHRR